MSATDEGQSGWADPDWDSALALLRQIGVEPRMFNARVIAAALAAEREEARAPFLALADELDETLDRSYRFHDAATRIRRAAEDTQ